MATGRLSDMGRKTAATDQALAVALHAANLKFGQRIQAMRVQRGLTQQELGKAVKYHWTTIQRLESGNGGLSIPLRRLILLAGALNTDLATLTRGIRLH